MKVFACKHDGVWIGGRSVVVAENEAAAHAALAAELRSRLLDPDGTEVAEISTSVVSVHVLFDGDY